MMMRMLAPRSIATASMRSAKRWLAGGRSFATVAESPIATESWQQSTAQQVVYSVTDEDSVMAAVQKLAHYDVGCLVTTDLDGE